MAFLNLDGCHVNADHITHVAESDKGCCVTWANGAQTTYEGENAAAVLKAVGAKHVKAAKAEKDDDEPHVRSHGHAHKAH